MAFRSILNSLNSEQIVMGSGFMIGFLYEFKLSKRTVNNPLTTIFNASIGGFLTYIGTGVISSILPPGMLFIIPVTAGVSCVYWKYNDIKKDKKD